MELKEFANLIDGRQYDYRMFTKEELQLAKDNRIVIVTGASDDLVELEGAITDEGDCWEGGKIYVKGLVLFPGPYGRSWQHEQPWHEHPIQHVGYLPIYL